MREVEFLPTWYPKVRQRKRQVALQAWATLTLVCGLGLWMLLAQRNVHAREIELSSLHTDLNQSEAELQRLDDLLELQKQLGKQDQIFVKIGRPIETTRVVTTLEQLMPRDMALMELTLENDESSSSAAKPVGTLAARAQQNGKNAAVENKIRFKLHGVAPTDVDLAEFILKLTGKPFFKQVELIYSHEKQDNGHVMREFEVCFVMDLGSLGAR